VAVLEASRDTQILLAAGLFLARVGDIGSTYLGSPNLRLEANPLVRRGRWPFAWLTLLACAIPFASPEAGMALLVASLMVTGSNLSKGWLMRGLGEENYYSLLEQVARRTSLRSALSFVIGGAVAFALVGLILVVVAKGPDTWAYWVADGILLYGFVLGLYGSAGTVRLFRRLANAAPSPGEQAE
jgi:hypothetical protein